MTNVVFVGSLVMRCGEGPEDFEYSNSTLEILCSLALAIDGRREAGCNNLCDGE